MRFKVLFYATIIYNTQKIKPIYYFRMIYNITEYKSSEVYYLNKLVMVVFNLPKHLSSKFSIG